MNKKTTYIALGATSLITVISLAAAVSFSSKNKWAKAEILALQEQIVRMEAFVPDKSAEPEVIYLNSNGETNELTALQAQLAEKDALIESMKSKKDQPGSGKRESTAERMAKMKEEDPEGYEEMVVKRQERQEKMRYSVAERTANFMDMDTSSMTEEQLANHEQLVEKMAQVWEMTEALQDSEDTSSRETMREMREISRDVQQLMDSERTVMFSQLGAELGYEGEDAEAFASYANEIIESTTFNIGRGGGGGGGGGGGR